MQRFKIPIVLLLYNRPDTTAKVLERLSEVHPSILIAIADGPQASHPLDGAECDAVRNMVEDAGKRAEVFVKNYSDENLGLRQRVSTGLSWVFEQFNAAIILEDDCVPAPSFFPYCAELLERYANDNRIGAISGDNFQEQPFGCEHSYYFSRFPHCWGWATWRRAWNCFDGSMKHWPGLRDSGWLASFLSSSHEVELWTRRFNAVYQRERDSWAFIWTYSCWCQNYLAVLPRTNLVSNIGFGNKATHTRDATSPLANLAVQDVEFPLRHPEIVVRNHKADLATHQRLYGQALPATPPMPSGGLTRKRRPWYRRIAQAIFPNSGAH